MSSEELNKMSNQTPSQDSRSDWHDEFAPRYDMPEEEVRSVEEQWDELLGIAGQDSVPGQAEMIWTAEKKKAYQKENATSFLQFGDEDG